MQTRLASRVMGLVALSAMVGLTAPAQAAEATAEVCTKDFYMQADYGAGFLVMHTDGSIWKSMANIPAERQVHLGTDNKYFPENSGQGVDFCVVKNDDALWCWGPNNDGVLGTGDFEAHEDPIRVIDSVAEATIQRYWGCARKMDGTVWCWGNVLETGVLGDGQTQPVGEAAVSHMPTQVTLPGPAKQLAVGFSHAFVILEDNRIFGWGGSGGFCLGLGDNEIYATPTEITPLGTDNAHISAGSFSTAVLKNDGRVITWAYASGAGTDPTQPVMAFTEITAVGRDVVTLLSRMHQTCAVKATGALWCWGDENPQSQLGNGSLDPEEVVVSPEIFGQGFFDGSGSPVAVVKMVKSQTCQLLEDGSLWCLGGGGFPDGVFVDQMPILAPTEQDWCGNCDILACSQTCLQGECVACTYDDQCVLGERPFCNLETGECVAEDPDPGANEGVSGCGGGARCTATPGRGPARFGAWLTLLGALGALLVLRRVRR